MAARLHHEQVTAAGATPTHWLAILHGIFGSGRNWASVARKLVERRRDWGALLVDLRQHGHSEPGEPPHDVAACSADLHVKLIELGQRAIAVDAIAGHSFGGKVALALRDLAPKRLRQTWLLDATPGARPDAARDPDNSVARVLALLERMPKQWKSRDAFIAAVIADGHEPGVASWLAMNLDGDTFRLRLDLVALRAMVEDYYQRDLWHAVESPALPGDVDVVIAERSHAFSAADRARLASAPPHVHVHRVAAGHWLNVDAPAAMIDLFAARLPA